MRQVPDDIVTEPFAVAPGTPKYLGPLTPPAGVWAGERGMNRRFNEAGEREERFIQSATP